MDTPKIPFAAYKKGQDPYIFVSYAHKDSDTVFPIIAELHKAGFPLWYDEGIDPGNEWPEEIATALLKCSLFIVFISSCAAESDNVREEINYALSIKKPFIHIWLEDASAILRQQYPGLEMKISNKQGIMRFRMEPENFYRKCGQSFEAFGIKRIETRVEAGKAQTPAALPEITAQAEADFQRGDAYFKGLGVAQDYAEAARWYRKAADQGHALAQFNLGNAYFKGRGVTQDYAEAARWYRKAADQGNVLAQFNLGKAYFKGEGVAQDYAEAARWYRKAADQGHANAQIILSDAYFKGEGVAQDYAEAARWVRKAADQGNAIAQNALGFAYFKGEGVAQDYAEAARWYRKAADQGHAGANENLAKMKQKGLIY
jgi:TPR repeat protein